jgi:pre-mRNA-splicing factor 18
MDFAALMSKEISKAKGPATSKTSDTTKDKAAPTEPPKKYLRRGELEAARIAAYNEEQERLQREREERLSTKRKLEEEEAERKREREEKKRKLAEESRKRKEEEEDKKERERRRKLGLPELPAKDDRGETPASEDAEEENIDEEELTKKLRALDEPARLFGENHRARLRRYRRLVKRAATLKKLSDGPIPTILEPVPGGQMIIEAKPPKDQDGRQFLFRQLASYFNMVLSEWELALAKRDVTVRESFQGKQAFNAMVQSRENMKPLFRRFEKGDLEDGLLEPIVEIVHKAQQRRYVDANDAYLRVSIGKA